MLASIIRSGSLPPAELCFIFSLVMLLFDYYEIIWTPPTAKQTCMIESVHSKFVHKLQSSYHSKFLFTLTERH